MNELGKRIKELRDAAQLTQAELAALSLKSVETISNFERGKTIPSVQTLYTLAEKMNVSVSEFFDDEPPRSQTEPLDKAIHNKVPLLDTSDKELLLGMMDLMVSRQGKP